MANSVLAITPAEFAKLQKALPGKTAAEKLVKENFTFTAENRAMLKQLVEVLECFAFMTDELQSNRVNISRVIPGYQHIVDVLTKHATAKDGATRELANNILVGFKERFDKFIDQDYLVFGTFLDCNFGLESFEGSKHSDVRKRLIRILKNTTSSNLPTKTKTLSF
jgi:hypothetical protein